MSKFGSKLSSFSLKLFGWDTEDLNGFDSVEKAVLIMAPHTSIWDFLVGKMVVSKYNRKCVFFIKKEAFGWPVIGKILKRMGGIPINRGQINTHVEDAAEALNNNDQLWVIITPEGTRKQVKRWKSGFHRIALKADVPILISVIDYKKKKATIVAKFYPSEDFNSDLEKILPYYDGVCGFHRRG
ncbi:1-acyl-sn-glycerol-3-phosphate acyltransferase [Bacteroidales bacterium OttesenSCG-928-K22]|nr:1-acyl-sn-glycerol-3-phosphate acyltransferase [Bacteroidales bacterium OttesenSCG-928-L14]MDL2240215.1 1-acyl-sn-glycerol-3-phosphate acyltransferase [Bacteroidales bacterium OttesenSCG-928-K22]